MKKKITLLDVTLREGSYLVDFQLPEDQVSRLVEYIDATGIEYIELGDGRGLGAARFDVPAKNNEVECFKLAKKIAKKSKIGTIAIVGLSDLSNIDEVAPFIDFIRIGVKINEATTAAPFIERAKEKGLFTFVQMVGTSILSSSKAAAAASKLEKIGTDVVYIVDTIGYFTPKTVKEYVKAIQDKVSIPIGFHGHNNLGMAIINTLEALNTGCQWADGSILGVGRQAGNAQLEVLALLLEKEGYKTNIDISLLLDIAESLVPTIFKKYKGIDPSDVWAAFCNIDLQPAWIYQKLALITGLDTKKFIQEISKIKGFVTLNTNDKFIAISKRFDVPIEIIMKSVRLSPNRFC